MKQHFTIKTILLVFFIIGYGFSLKAQENNITVADMPCFTVLDSPRVQVFAQYYPDSFDPNSPYVRIYWSGMGSYKVYRSDCYNTTNPTMIAQNITTGEYIDTNWSNLDPGTYMYGIRVNTEAMSWSNCLDKEMYSEMVSITVQMGDGNSPEGTTVSFVNHNSTEQALYPISPITLDETGYYIWDVFRNGNYQITITKSEYETIVDEVAIWENSYSMSYTLIPSNAYNITVSANPSNGGTVTGGGYYQYGASCTVTATANNAYAFVYWTENGNIVSTDANYTFTVNSNRNLVANFTLNAYNIIVSADPSNGGMVTGGGTYTHGDNCSVQAIPNEGYTFLEWTENGNVVSTNAFYTFVVTGDRNLVAQFQAQNYTITTMVTPEGSGTVSGGGSGSHYGDQVILTAIANEGFSFRYWQDGILENPRIITVTNDTTFTATFTSNTPDLFTITVLANPEEGGTVRGGGNYAFGVTCTLMATPNPGYIFTNWKRDNLIVSTDAAYSFKVNEDASYIATFTPIQQYTITVKSNNNDGGSVSGGGLYYAGVTCTLHATPATGYQFDNWIMDSVVVSTNLDYSFEVTSDATYTAYFSVIPSFRISASSSSHGSISPDGDIYVELGETITFTLIPDEGYKMSTLMIDGDYYSPIESITFYDVNRNHTIQAEFDILGIEENETQPVKVSPNPAKRKALVECQGMKRITLYNLSGTVVYDMETHNDSEYIFLDQLSSGIYPMKVMVEGNQYYHAKLVIIE